MLFRRLCVCALAVGVLTGLVDSFIQRWQVVPLILAAEVFEKTGEAEVASATAHSHEATAAPAGPVPAVHTHADAIEHTHDASAWEPEDGLERTAYTVLANMLNATGIALLLMPLMAWWNRRQGGQPLALHTGYGAVVRHGLFWGVAAWASLFALPSLGLPPELPGMQAAALHARQAWWLLTALCGAGGLATLLLVRAKWRVLGLGLLVLPFAVGAPQHAGSPFAGMDADVTTQMQVLANHFVLATTLASAMQSLVLGGLSAVAVARWIAPLLGTSRSTGAVTKVST